MSIYTGNRNRNIVARGLNVSDKGSRVILPDGSGGNLVSFIHGDYQTVIGLEFGLEPEYFEAVISGMDVITVIDK